MSLFGVFVILCNCVLVFKIMIFDSVMEIVFLLFIGVISLGCIFMIIFWFSGKVFGMDIWLKWVLIWFWVLVFLIIVLKRCRERLIKFIINGVVGCV